MKFSDLYNYANSLPDKAIPVEALAARIVAHHPNIGEVNFRGVDLDSKTMLGYMIYERDRSSPYSEEFTEPTSAMTKRKIVVGGGSSVARK